MTMETTVRVDRRATPARAGVRQWLALAVLMLPVILVAADNTVLNFALPAISEALEPGGVALLWIVDAYPLVLAGLLVAMGSLADRIGRRRLLLIGASGFAVVSILAAFVPSAPWLIAARVALGFFGATLMPSTMSLLRTLFQDRNQRRLAVAVLGSGFSAGAALGPILGGVLLSVTWWGAIFLIAVPVLIPLLILTPILIPESKDPKPGPVDVVSIVLSLGAMAPFVYGIKSLATEGVGSAGLWGLGVGLASGYLFVRRQRRMPVPMLDMGLFRNRVFTGAILVNLLSIVAFIGGLFFVTQHLQLVLGMGPVDAALVLVPGLIATIAAGFLVVPFARRYPARVVVPIALVFSMVGYGMIAVLGEGLTAPAFLVAFICIGIGVGGAETISNDLVIDTAPPDKVGAASAVSETAYEVGSVLGTAVLGTIITVWYRASLVLPGGLSAAQQDAATGTIGGAAAVAKHLPPHSGAALMDSARTAFDSGVWLAAGLATLFIVAAAVVGAVLLRSRVVLTETNTAVPATSEETHAPHDQARDHSRRRDRP